MKNTHQINSPCFFNSLSKKPSGLSLLEKLGYGLIALVLFQLLYRMAQHPYNTMNQLEINPNQFDEIDSNHSIFSMINEYAPYFVLLMIFLCYLENNLAQRAVIEKEATITKTPKTQTL
jgi:Na+/melibiose symporter-like transporter